MLHVYYRACAAQTGQRRPPFFSKLGSLRNFLVAMQRIDGATFTLVNDGELGSEFRRLVEPVGTVEILPNVGNSASCWHVLQKAAQLPASALVYFVEDDYLHCPDALEKLITCHAELAPDYITLYDHPDRYTGADVPLDDQRIYLAGRHHWRTVESTTMTFAATAETVRQDLSLFQLYVCQTRSPADRMLFHHLQGVGPYRDLSWRRELARLVPPPAYRLVRYSDRGEDVSTLRPLRQSRPRDLMRRLHRLERYRYPSPHRRLLGPIPSLATHCEQAWLAPGIDWARLA